MSQSFTYSATDALVSCLKNIKIYVKIYIKTAPTWCLVLQLHHHQGAH